jgi:hypothetical protein
MHEKREFTKRNLPKNCLERNQLIMFDLLVIGIFGIASALTYLLVLGCEYLMEKRS